MSSAIQKLLTTEVVAVYQEACKNFGNKRVACSLCVDCCDEDAISLQNQTPVIVDTKCIDCGACVSECPVNAIDHIRKPYAKVAQYVDEFPLAEITCDQVEEFNRGIKVPCLLYLDFPLLSQYADRCEELHIYTEHCQSCRKVGAEKISRHLEKLQWQFENSGAIFKIKTKHQLPQSSSEQTVNAVSRRELLSRFSISSIKELILPTSKKDDTQTVADEKFESLSIVERIQFKKKLLNDFYMGEKRLNEVEYQNSNASFSFAVNDSCNGCNVCEKICPTKAISWKTNEKVAQLIFDSRLCVECDKCLACPIGALTKSDPKKEEIDFKKELISMNIAECSDCGTTFKTTQETEVTCFFCKAKKEKDPSRFFTS
ncbi:4Fe-4S dicluster domain-containing protein [Bacillaceae bacterium IKA-2]|nr:4Fe-4S dicluster domain-containing protein [Bacillaceae bacterium IKA-2]